MKVMILGGGENQIPLIQKAREIGYYVVLCDYLSDCPGKEYASIHYQISTYDYDAVKRIALKEKINGVITNSEPVLHIASRLSDELRLPSVPPSVMEMFLNKDKMRDHLTPLGLSDVSYKVCRNKKEAIEFYNTKKAKMIIKPIDSSASRGVHSINSEKDILDYFSECMSQNRRQSTVLIEEYIPGVEFTVDGICISSKHTTLGISKKKHFSYNENVSNELIFSYFDDKYDYDFLREYNDRIVHSTGLTYGMTHAEYKFSNGKFHLIEIAARGGGVFISTKIVPFLSNTDTVKILIDSACGNCNISDYQFPEDAKRRSAVLEFFDTLDNKEGIVKEIKGINFLESEPRIIDYKLEFSVGYFITPAKDDSKRIGYYIAIANSISELQELMQSISREFGIVLED